jgi:hypothetical protein
MHTAEPLVRKPSVFEVELAIEKLKSHKLPGTDPIPAELIKAGGRSITLLLLFGLRKNYLRSARSQFLYLSIRTALKQIVVIIGAYHFCNYVQ